MMYGFCKKDLKSLLKKLHCIKIIHTFVNEISNVCSCCFEKLTHFIINIY